jgi:hypothetical protein
MHIRQMVLLSRIALCLALASVCVFSGCREARQGGEEPGHGTPPPKRFVASACSDQWNSTNCGTANQCLTGTCTVNVVNNGGVATATIQGQNPQSPQDQILCVKPGASLQYQAPPSPTAAPNQFVGDFGGISPWQSARSYIIGGGSTSDTETASSSSSCYKYDLFVCTSAAPGTTFSCGVTDPKIIVGN